MTWEEIDAVLARNASDEYLARLIRERGYLRGERVA